ncbi:DUF1702 family protein [Isoptericola sp. b515]|uniref:DUF1702 family protein n=1 Tax=Isoptericola sp. b515 TaxID=3064652 RepID=UPI0027125A60|nr:DUF1702 family protein [Isoptericola sp. b515]MDO8147757.1 DUF1702 family protein [Isoptericola sp. b515]
MTAPTAVLRRASAPWRAARARVMTPSRSQVDPRRRGFHPWTEGNSIVEPVGNAFLDGFAVACHRSTAAAVLEEVGRVSAGRRGFALEGAAMACTLRSRLEPWNRGVLDELLRRADEHTYLAHVGVGWALARLPRPWWPDLARLDRSVVPLVLDGYAFHEVFFRTGAVLGTRSTRFPRDTWPGGPEVATQHLAQGIGRGLWFVAGGSAGRLAGHVQDFPTDQRASLWAGVGLAMTYAGGRGPEGMRAVLAAAGDHRRWVRQGCAFAVEARARSATTVPHTRTAAEVICERPWDDVVSVVDALRPRIPAGGPGNWHAYEEWRAAVADELGDD